MDLKLVSIAELKKDRQTDRLTPCHYHDIDSWTTFVKKTILQYSAMFEKNLNSNKNKQG